MIWEVWSEGNFPPGDPRQRPKMGAAGVRRLEEGSPDGRRSRKE